MQFGLTPIYKRDKTTEKKVIKNEISWLTEGASLCCLACRWSEGMSHHPAELTDTKSWYARHPTYTLDINNCDPVKSRLTLRTVSFDLSFHAFTQAPAPSDFYLKLSFTSASRLLIAKINYHQGDIHLSQISRFTIPILMTEK